MYYQVPTTNYLIFKFVEHPPPTLATSPRRPSTTSQPPSSNLAVAAGLGSIDDIIEEVVEHDMEEKLGKRLNISMVGI